MYSQVYIFVAGMHYLQYGAENAIDFSLLESLGVRFQEDEFKTPLYDETSIESSQKGVYLAGVVCGGLKTNKWFIENSRIHAPMIMEAILKA